MGDQRSGPARTLFAAERPDQAPKGSESKNQAEGAKTVLFKGDAGVVRLIRPAAVPPPQIGVVLDEENGDGDQEKARPLDELLYGDGWVGIG